MFSIKKLTVSGPNKRDSEIVFGNRLTIIQGPSNTGKTMILNCIEYVLGGKHIPISENHGYDTISLEIEKDKCSITFTRKIGENKVSVNSSDETIPSDSYSTNSTDSLNPVLLRLLNINKEVKIISNSNFRRLRLTWNSFRHLFFIDENSIISGNSIIESKHDASKTALLSSLYYLSTGDSLEDKAEQMSKTIHSARKEGVLEFIKKNLESLKDRKSKLTDNQNKNNNQLDLQKLSSELQELDSEIRRKIENNNKLLLEITEYREELSNVSLLLARYSDLKSQYLSDQQRLSFIADGEIVSDNGIDGEKDITCPICHSLVHSSPNESYLESARAEFQKIEIQLI